MFPEIDYDKVDQIWGMDVIVCTSAQDRRRGARAAARLQLSISAARGPRDQPRKAFGGHRWPRRARLRRTTGAAGWPPSMRRSASGSRRSPSDLQAAGGGALCGAHQARRDAAQLLADADQEPLRDHGPRARLLPEAQDVPQPASGSCEPGSHPGHDQVELVREQNDGNQRSLGRHADAHPQRADAAAPESGDARVQHSRARPRRAGRGRLHSRLHARRAEGRASRPSRSSSSIYNGQPAIREIKRVSTPGRRVYSPVRDLPTVANGLGVAILSTPKGVMSDSKAREENVGGEILCSIF